VIESIVLFREALYGALVIAVACSVLGVYVVLRRIVFVGAALAQISSTGIALSLWLGSMGILLGLASHPVLLSLIVTLAGVAFFAMSGQGAIATDAKIGATYALAAAVGVLLIATSKSGDVHDIYLQGNILGITRRDTLVLLAATVPVLVVHAVFFKEFLFVSFDRETARALGYNVRRWDLALYLTLGFVIAFAMEFAGVMLVFSFLVLPAVTGRLLANGMRGTVTWSVASAVLAAIVGFALSVILDLPTGPAIIAISGVLLCLAWARARVVRAA
jgi:zinc transport system permease protein